MSLLEIGGWMYVVFFVAVLVYFLSEIAGAIKDKIKSLKGEKEND